jgi:hypothetical protein
MNNNNAIQQSTIKKISEGKYYAHKDDLYFVLERVTSENIGFWKDYAATQAELCGVGKMFGELGFTSGTIFSYALNFYEDSDVWVAFATQKDITQPNVTLNKIGDIEMCVTVSTTPDLPFSTHLGIFKSYEFTVNAAMDSMVRNAMINNKADWEYLGAPYKNLVSHKGLSVDFHAFAAKATQEIYGNKDYMVTRPATNMLAIMEKNLSEELIYVGSSWSNPESPFIPKVNHILITKPSGEKVSVQKPTFWSGELNGGMNPITVIDINKLANKVSFDILSDAQAQENSNTELSDHSAIESMAEKVSETDLGQETSNQDDIYTKSLPGALEHFE